MKRWLLFVPLIILLFTPRVSSATAYSEAVKFCSGELVISEFVRPAETVNLVIHLHGFEKIKDSFLYANTNALLFSFYLAGISSVYTNHFSDPARFQEILDRCEEEMQRRYAAALSSGIYPDAKPVDKNELKQKNPHALPKIGRVTLVAFSAGYGGVREILKNEKFYGMVDAVYLMDCPHTGYTEDGKVIPEQIAPFLRFAKDAVESKKTFIMTHTKIVPGSYASTTECADYLIEQLELTREPEQSVNEYEMVQLTKCESGNFMIYGYEGDTAPDHMKHLYAMHLFLNKIPFLVE